MSQTRFAAQVVRALIRAQASAAWNETADPEERAWLGMLAVCEHVHPLGETSAPAPHQVERTVGRVGRNEAMRRDFDGSNYAALGRRHGVSTRQVRRIVDRPRRPRPKNGEGEA